MSECLLLCDEIENARREGFRAGYERARADAAKFLARDAEDFYDGSISRSVLGRAADDIAALPVPEDGGET